ncbi:UDP-glucose 6-dehydrogenase [Acetobacter pasteurianus]|uniref:UDP-glucose 6-dehydrogenase n=1 Tax=Acetobacter pasteurianus TaxID=438 RepID=A0A1A0DH34_ACEPA|nr:UDP-glucose/GDP-mannose dehydrogenase family protein [Acetobacter pasteurianus]OAZ74275.1 UDP-glucose 6-dehydrogenase [Acetobacter pasteurianus]RCL04491.1 UDP-glucose 6-dehydrogenase [Acetobacter pasteurianus]GAB32028.1 UDP-glucose 6-dehydrogenase [Acetobacter pasteurianus subsp. pasteurianus LMG 1262 = NBRC 106471]GCD51158.1 UDP-glucose 6-dehydrogenase [Acetobacter pasteurianus subsp. pasteurianus LMG 1262 = NBRC 106471]
MRIAVIGGGYVGLVSGACFAEIGHHVTIVESVTEKLNILLDGGVPIYEAGLEKLIHSNRKAGRINFCNNIAEGIKDASVVFIAVGTPTRKEDARADTQYVFSAVRDVVENATHSLVIVTKSTVPLGTGQAISEIIQNIKPSAHIDVVSNPEFLREGCAIEDFLKPDRIVIGAENDNARKKMEELYKPITDAGYPLLSVSVKSAELIKYASNAFLAMKVAFINEISDICERSGAVVSDVSKGMGLDNRIGAKFLHAGPGYGGSCFPKDTLALIHIAADYGCDISLVKATVESNDKRKSSMVNRVIEACNGSVKDKKIALLGLTFKAGTDDMRDSPSIPLVEGLVKEGAIVNAYDPEGMSVARSILPEAVNYADTVDEVLHKADAAVIVTEWPEFRRLKPEYFEEKMSSKIVVDFRNIYSKQQFSENGFSYYPIGSASVEYKS